MSCAVMMITLHKLVSAVQSRYFDFNCWPLSCDCLIITMKFVKKVDVNLGHLSSKILTDWLCG